MSVLNAEKYTVSFYVLPTAGLTHLYLAVTPVMSTDPVCGQFDDGVRFPPSCASVFVSAIKLLRRAIAPREVSSPVHEFMTIERLWLNSITFNSASPIEPWVAV